MLGIRAIHKHGIKDQCPLCLQIRALASFEGYRKENNYFRYIMPF